MMLNRINLMAMAALCTLIHAGTAMAGSSYSTDFENFALGGDTTGTNPLITDPGAGTNNWRGNGASGLADNGVPGSMYDGEIVDTGDPGYDQAYRLSNAKVSGNYDTTHAATPTVDAIGETSTGATPGTFCFSFDFKSADSLPQDGLLIDVTPFKANSSERQGIIRITDDVTNGLSVGWWEVVGGGFNFVQLATGLSRTDWHSVSVEMTFIDGANNDSVAVNVNGSATTGLGTWESYYPLVNVAEQPVDSVIFRVASPIDFQNNTGGVAGLDDGGIYFDNLYLESKPIPEPTSLALIGLGGLAALRRRR